MNITAALVKELRERTGSGMMECKKALVEANGDIDAAIEEMRKSGLAKADKRSGRTAAEGVICIRVSADARRAALVEINCETDFVSRGDDFQAFADQVTECALERGDGSLDDLLRSPLASGSDKSIEAARQELVAKLGENISVRRYTGFKTTDGSLASYLHGTGIGVVVEMNGGDQALGKDVAMHVAASAPVCLEEKDVPAELIAKEREIYSAQAAESGKPEHIMEKMVDGRIRKYLSEITLVGQPFVKDPDISVGDLLRKSGASVTRFERFAVGEGIERKTENFAEEVMAQVRGK